MIRTIGTLMTAGNNEAVADNGFKRSLTLDQPGSDLTDFPVLFYGTYTWLKLKSSGGEVENSNGYDIRFYSDSTLTTLLSFERVSWDGSTGDVEFWVKIPTLTSASATVIYIAYGNPNFTTDVQDVNGTWNSGFKAVWHLKDLSASVVPVTDDTFAATTVTGTAISATPSAWDNSIRGEPGNVLYDPGNAIGGDYLLFYTGYAAGYSSGQTYLGIAYSSDKISWTKYASNPITLPPSNEFIEDPYVIKVSGTYYLYGENAGNTVINLWTSTDLTTWTAQGTVLAAGAGWDSGWVGSANVWKEGSTWYMLYEGNAGGGKMGLATSSDGITWTKDAANPVFEGADTTWGGALSPDDIYKDGSTYYLLYHADAGGSTFKSGLATSTDLINWTDSPRSPINTGVSTMYLDGLGHFIQAGATGATETALYLSDGIPATLPDSTINLNDATNNGANATASGKVGDAMDFNGSSDYLNCGADSSLDITSNGTWACWINLNGQPGEGVWFRIFDRSGASPYGIFAGYATVGGVGKVGMFYGGLGQSFVTNALSNSTWYHLAYVHDDTNDTDKMYVNGSAVSTVTSRTDNPGSQSSAFFLMAENPAAKYVNGILDETHISNVARNADWIAAEYSNQNDPANFYAIGTETPV